MKNNQRVIGSSQALADALDHASILAEINRPILICGERGSGKELIAERLHYLSPRWDQPFISLNCAAISDSLMESELFGHEAGAFTGATKTYQGRFERADGGTLFLDELGTMSLRVQEKLLRLIEYGEFERLGSAKTQRVNVRIVAATNANLPSLSKQGEFRADLLDRLTFDVIQVPPLRDRKEDIEELANFFAIKLSTELGWEYFQGFSPKALTSLKQYDWPGNIRELKNVVERSVYRWGFQADPVEKIVINPFTHANEEASDSLINTQAVLATTIDSKPSGFSLNSSLSLKEQTFQLQQHLIQQALKENQHNQRLAAQSLGLTYDQFRGLLKKLK
ncbi:MULTISPECIES: phage shock protein operon transcriptional activator [Marinomonas]|uniref:Phage shock protein operon transcriptional activator n=1 Tax=Marinomonas arctica TaxID=383750 RepID=A0A7H1J7F6_9GAMM|nr:MULTISPECIES: phage shock protein operon transcriptional activator [Marinomonas]MCS7485800.1 phage shock protein [Marinomonas sp. BSi20414]QNT06422.1 phage shock protein operon transcriptional activator [Marinomonas arctica]GGN27991.1 PSP operon transcriptional activator [Marinomonas arctica]